MPCGDLSSKVLADVVEALIGAAMVDGGLTKAYKCVQRLLPDETWFNADVIFNTLTPNSTHPGNYTSLDTLEHLIGHQFQHNSRGLIGNNSGTNFDFSFWSVCVGIVRVQN